MKVKINPLLFLTLVSLLTACSSNSVSTMGIELPTKSIGYDRPALAKDMISSVGLFIKNNLACANWSLVEVIESKAEGQIVFTSDGQLYRGKVIEKWGLQECGNKLSLSLEITPASQGGSIIRIKNL